MIPIYIAGTGALAAETTEYIHAINKTKASDNQFEIMGYFDHSPKNHKKYSLSANFLGEEKSFDFQGNESIVVAIGQANIRHHLLNFFLKKNLRLPNIIHPTAIVSSTASLGTGNIIAPQTYIGPNSRLGNYNFINYQTNIGHDSIIGNRNVVCPSCNITGECVIGSGNFLGTNVSLLPTVSIGSYNKIQAGTTLRESLNDGMLYLTEEKTSSLQKYSKESIYE